MLVTAFAAVVADSTIAVIVSSVIASVAIFPDIFLDGDEAATVNEFG